MRYRDHSLVIAICLSLAVHFFFTSLIVRDYVRWLSDQLHGSPIAQAMPTPIIIQSPKQTPKPPPPPPETPRVQLEPKKPEELADRTPVKLDPTPPPVKVEVKPPPPEPVQPPEQERVRNMMGEAEGKGDASNSVDGDEIMKAQEAEQTQAFLSRDPADNGQVGEPPVETAAPSGNGGQPAPPQEVAKTADASQKETPPAPKPPEKTLEEAPIAEKPSPPDKPVEAVAAVTEKPQAFGVTDPKESYALPRLAPRSPAGLVGSDPAPLEADVPQDGEKTDAIPPNTDPALVQGMQQEIPTDDPSDRTEPVAIDPKLPAADEAREEVKPIEIAQAEVDKEMPEPVPETRASTPAAAVVPGQPGVPTPAADPAPMSDSESDPFASIGSVEFRPGKVEARFGRKVKTVRPRLSLAGKIDVATKATIDVVLAVHTDDTGKVTKVQIIRSSGSDDIDLPIQRAMYEWWIEPPKDKEGKEIADVMLWTLKIR